MLSRVTARIVERFIKAGALTVSVGNERLWTVTGPAPGPAVSLRFSDWPTLVGCAVDPSLRVGEAYVDGRLQITAGTLEQLLHLAALNTDRLDSDRMMRALHLARQVRFALSPRRRTARAAVAHHYDLKDELFESFLDRDLQYSCAYFLNPTDDLETAQTRKKLRLAAKLLLEPGQRILDIGSGWGGLAIELARLEDVHVDGITLSEAQWAASVRRATSAGVSQRVHFEVKDYREVEGRYDRIVSVGMLEHVGRDHLGAYFKKIAELLTDDGVAVVHGIGSRRDPGPRQPWIDKYIFPGTFLAPLDMVFGAIQQTPLHVTDVEVLWLHYAETLKAWRTRFNAQRESIRCLYDDRFVRMWDFYLTGCEAVFRTGHAMVFQVQLARSPSAVPLSRAYLEQVERAASLR